MKKTILSIIIMGFLLGAFALADTEYPASNPMGADSGYNFNSNDGTDFIGSHDGTVVGCSYSADTPFGSGKSLYCDGTDDNYLNSNFLLGRMDADFTICFWFKRDGAVGNNEVFYGSQDGTEEYIYLEYAPSLRWWQKVGADAMYNTEAADTMNSDGWRHICTKNTGSDVTNAFIYFNGTYRPVTNNTGGQTTSHFSQPLYFLANNVEGTDATWVAGYIDDILIFNETALTEAQISELYLGDFPNPFNVTVLYPLNSTGFNEGNLTAVNNKVWINITSNTTVADTCYLNDTYWTLNSNNGTHWYFLNNSLLSDNKYIITAYCNKSGTDNGTTTLEVRIDTTPPALQPAVNLANNNTVIINGSLITQINLTDNIEVYSFNISLQNSTGIYAGSNLGTALYNVNISYKPGDNIYFDVYVCDAHTNQQIQNFADIKTYNNGLDFVEKKKFVFWDDKYVRVYPSDFSSYHTPNAVKLRDRYTFEFNRNTEPSLPVTFIVESSDFIDIVNSQKYKGHLVIPAQERWIDFENPEVKDVSFNRVSNTKIEVTLYGITSSKMIFNSIGELNCYEARYYWGDLNPIETFSNSTIVGSLETFTLNTTLDTATMTTINATLFYNNTAYYTEGTENFSVSLNVPSSPPADIYNYEFNWVVEVDGVSYNLTKHNQTVLNMYLDTCNGSNIVTRIFNISNEQDPNLNLNATLELEATLWYLDSSSKNIYLSYGRNTTHRLCIYPGNLTFSADIYIRYTNPDSFTHRYYIINGSFNGTNQTVPLYNFNSTTDISDLKITTRDKSTYDYMSNVIGKLQRRYSGEGVWRTVQMDESGDFGNIFFNIEEEDTDYRIIFYDRQLNILKQTETLKFVCTTGVCELVVLLDPYSTTTPSGELTIDTSYDNATGIVDVNWSNNMAYTSTVRSILTKETITGTTTICDVTQTGAEGSTACNISDYTGTVLLKVQTAENGIVLPEKTQWIEIPSMNFASYLGNAEGSFWNWAIGITVVGFGLASPSLAVISLIFSLIAMYFLKTMTLLNITFIVIAGAIAIAIGLKVRK